MAVDNPFEITYGSQAVGGTSDVYLLNGPYVFDVEFNTMRMVFEIVVVASSYGASTTGLRDRCDVLEIAFRKRDQSLTVELDRANTSATTKWVYTFGTDADAANDGILNSECSLSKTGDEQTDRGFSRSYTCVITGDMPADDSTTGLRDLSFNVAFEAGRQKIVTMEGSYTALAGTAAVAKYEAAAGADTEASTFLTALDSGATFELTQENYVADRNDHIVQFNRQYVELLANQTTGSLDAADIRDHQLTFTQLSQHSGDSLEGIYRLRRVVGTYDCAIDIEQTTDLSAVFDTEVRPHIIALFETEFSPQVFAVEDRRVSYDETAKRMSVSITFLYQHPGGTDILEVRASRTTVENRTLDYTFMHNKNEFAAIVDTGWATKERINTRRVVVIGEESAKSRVGEKPKDGPAGDIGSSSPSPGDGGVIIGGGGGAGWNTIQSTSQVEWQWVGDPDEDQLQLSILNETVVERFNADSGGGGLSSNPGGGFGSFSTPVKPPGTFGNFGRNA